MPNYRAAVINSFDIAATQSAMFFVIGGSATKTVIIKRIRLSGATLTAVAYFTFALEKWSTAPTGGTAVTLTMTQTDSSPIVAATASLCQVYTGAPGEGSLVGTVGAVRALAQATTAAAGGLPPLVEWDLRPNGVPLHGAAEVLSVATGANPASALTVALEVEWDEE